MSPEFPNARDETPIERADRNLSELLGELRIALPGVQVLFAFLLTLPFTARFDRVNAFERNIYFVSLLLAALGTVLFIAPTAYHRLIFRMDDKEHLVQVTNGLAIAGLACLAMSMTGVIMLISDVLFGGTTTVLMGVLTAAIFAGGWYAMPLWRRRRRLAELAARESGKRPASGSPPDTPH